MVREEKKGRGKRKWKGVKKEGGEKESKGGRGEGEEGKEKIESHYIMY